MCYSHQHLNEPHYWPTFCTISLFRILWPNFALYFIGCLTFHFFSPSPYLLYRTLSLEQKIVDFCACRWCSICASLLKHAIGTDISLLIFTVTTNICFIFHISLIMAQHGWNPFVYIFGFTSLCSFVAYVFITFWNGHLSVNSCTAMPFLRRQT